MVETAESKAMDRYVELVQQYPGQEQVDLAVEIEVPGSWFGFGSMGSLTTEIVEFVDTNTKLYGKESRESEDRSSAAEEVEENGEED